MSLYSPVYGRRGMVVSGYPLATLAGIEQIEAGGAVADAAIAAAAVLAVTLPQYCSIGGDAFAVIHDGLQGTVALNGSGPCPAGLSPEALKGEVPARGANSAVVPTLVRAWAALHARFGRRSWPALFARAIQYAGDGFAASFDLGRAVAEHRRQLDADPGCRAAFAPAFAAGALFRQPALARTLAMVAERGADAFYRGEIAARLAAYASSQGGALSVADLAAADVAWVPALSTAYRGLSVHVAPPNSYGLYLLLQLRALEGAPASALAGGTSERLGHLIRAAERAFAAGAPWVTDPAFVPAARAPEIDRILAAPPGTQAPAAAAGGTAGVAVADGAGNGISFIQSVYRPFGAMTLDPATGILLNNRLASCSLDAAHPNRLEPGRRPAHTLSPALAFADGRLRYVLGSPGGPGQTLTLTQVVSNLVDRGLSLAEAVRAPRWSWDLAGRIVIEAPFPPETAGALAARGIAATATAADLPYFGSAEVIGRRADGTLESQADFRREAAAIGI
jgi:gamma-glutamyltranspeptidase/glutathione hydrolase